MFRQVLTRFAAPMVAVIFRIDPGNTDPDAG